VEYGRFKPKTVICIGVVLLIGGLVDQVQASSGPWYARIDGMIVASVGVYQIRQGRKRLLQEKEQAGPLAGG
jgi:hypothetical protein